MTSTETGLFFAGISFMLGILGKAIYDSYKSGRVEKRAVYLKTTEFEKICSSRQKACCVPTLKKDVAQMDTRVKETEKQLDTGREDFRTIIRDISQVKQTLAGMPNQAEFDGLRVEVSEVKESIAGIQATLKFAIETSRRREERE
ncbi:MAG TPA: hypothetical protein VGD14_09465 [bacterium]